MAAGAASDRLIPSLDGLRALSIVAVLVGHVNGSRGGFHSREFSAWNPAHVGVCVFYVISGYLITTLLLSEQRKRGDISLGQFYLRRAFRIFPAFFAYLGALAALQLAGLVSLSTADWVHALTYTMNYHDAHARSWYVGHLWSLSVEEQFYLLWPAALALAGVARGLRGALWVVFLAPLVRIATWALWPDRAHMIGETFETGADALATGCLLAGHREALHLDARYRRLLTSAWLPALVLAMLATVRVPSAKVEWLVVTTVRNVAIALVLDRSITVRTGPWYALLNSAPVAWVGRMSYSLYLWQQLFINRRGAWAVQAVPWSLACALACALASYHLVEQPMLRARARWFPDKPRTT